MVSRVEQAYGQLRPLTSRRCLIESLHFPKKIRCLLSFLLTMSCLAWDFPAEEALCSWCRRDGIPFSWPPTEHPYYDQLGWRRAQHHRCRQCQSDFRPVDKNCSAEKQPTESENEGYVSYRMCEIDGITTPNETRFYQIPISLKWWERLRSNSDIIIRGCNRSRKCMILSRFSIAGTP